MADWAEEGGEKMENSTTTTIQLIYYLAFSELPHRRAIYQIRNLRAHLFSLYQAHFVVTTYTRR